MTSPKSLVQARFCMAREQEVLVGNKLNISQQHATTATWANQTLGCIHGDITCRNRDDRDVIIPLYSVLDRPHMDLCVHLCFPQLKKKNKQKTHVDRLERIQRRVTKINKVPENLPYEERLKETSLFTLEKAQEALHHNIPLLKGWLQRWQRFSLQKDPQRATSTSCTQEMFHLYKRKKMFPVRTTLNKLPRDMAGSPPLAAFKMWLDRVLHNIVQAPSSHRKLDLMIFSVPFQPVLLMILWFTKRSTYSGIQGRLYDPRIYTSEARWKHWNIIKF